MSRRDVKICLHRYDVCASVEHIDHLKRRSNNTIPITTGIDSFAILV